MLNLQTNYEAQITGYTSDGRGVAHIEDCVIFIPNAIAGERCSIRVIHQGKHAAVGKIEQILEKSPHRIARECPYAKMCGGCTFWHMDYEEECRLKAQRIKDALVRIGGFTPKELPILGAAEIHGYRNKAQYPVAEIHGKAEAGFYRAGTHTVTPVARCLIQPQAADDAKAAVVSYMQQYHVPAYDERRDTGLIRHVYVRCGFATGQVLVGIVANGEQLPHTAPLISSLRQKVTGLCGVVLCINREKGNVILGQSFRTLWGEGYLEDRLCDLAFRISPRSFYQVNRDQAQHLYEKAVAFADLHGTETVLDLYCGTGTITCIMAKHAARAIGVEVVADAVKDAEQNARRNHLENVQFECADAGQAAQRLADQGIHPDVVVVDPPRKGLDEAAIHAVAQMQPSRLVYVSCDPATLARDIKRFASLSYHPTKVEAVDLFPRTAHVETVVLMSKVR